MKLRKDSYIKDWFPVLWEKPWYRSFRSFADPSDDLDFSVVTLDRLMNLVLLVPQTFFASFAFER